MNPLAKFVVEYTNADDGIWLRCIRCDWRENCGYWPTVLLLRDAAVAHLIQSKPCDHPSLSRHD